jgi:hypothetical protein
LSINGGLNFFSGNSIKTLSAPLFGDRRERLTTESISIFFEDATALSLRKYEDVLIRCQKLDIEKAGFFFDLYVKGSTSDTVGDIECDTNTIGCPEMCHNYFFPFALARYWQLQVFCVGLPTIMFMGKFYRYNNHIFNILSSL